MAWVSDFRASTVAFDPGPTTTPKYIRAITQSSVRLDNNIVNEVTSGGVYPDTQTLGGVKAMATFSTLDIFGAFDAFGLWQACLQGGATDDGLTLYGQKQDCSGVAAGSVHNAYKITNGVVVPRTLTVDHQGNAVLSYEVFARYESPNNPVIYTANSALPLGGTTPVGRFTMEELAIGGVAVEGKKTITIDWGVEVQTESADSEIFDTVVSVGRIKPRITIRGVSPSWFTSPAPITGVVAAKADTYIELRKRGVARATAAHILITAYGLVTTETIFDGTQTGPGETAIAIDCAVDASGNAPMEITLSTALA